MVSPIIPIVLGLAAAFLIPLSRRLGHGLFYLALVAFLAVPGSYLLRWVGSGGSLEPIVSFTAGVRPPFSIALKVGPLEAMLLTAVNLFGLVQGIILWRRVRRGRPGIQGMFVLLILGANGLVMTQDAFNVFVFLEIMSIATYGLLALDGTRNQLAAGFKYLIAGGISSILVLLGVVVLYSTYGTLSIPGMIEAAGSAAAGANASALTVPSSGVASAVAGLLAPPPSALMFTGAFLLFVGLLIELKPFPANGWALDAYQCADSGIAATISAVNAGTILFVMYKVTPVFPESLLVALVWVGVLTFAISNMIGIRQSDYQRMLGYSSVAQVGLVASVIGYGALNGFTTAAVLGTAGLLVVNHLFAKAGLFWIGGRRSAGITALSGLLPVLALVGLPPFPGFWAKWRLLVSMAGAGDYWFMALLLLGSLFEAVYLFGWYVKTYGRSTGKDDVSEEAGRFGAVLGGTAASAALVFVGVLVGQRMGVLSVVSTAIVGGSLVLALMQWVPSRVRQVLLVGLLGGIAWQTLPDLTGLHSIFGWLFAGGAVLIGLASLYRKRGGAAGQAAFLLTAGALVLLPAAESTLEFFTLWEFMTAGGFLLVLFTGQRQEPALRYLLFSLGGAYLLLAGFALAGGGELAELGAAVASLAPEGAQGAALGAASLGVVPLAVWSLIALGLLVKAGALGVHIWLPSAYAESGDEVTAYFSGVLSKAAVFGLLVFGATFVVGAPLVAGGSTAAAEAAGAGGGGWLVRLTGSAGNSALPFGDVLSWIGVLTALFGALLAVFQEDVKRLLAYSSMSQLGYMVLAVGLATHLGWTSAVYLSILHFVFKVMLFLAVAGVILRTGTRNMYQMGGLIKRMPLTFVSALMAIIAVSGVPPLAGFGGKWLLYTALMESGWYVRTVLAFFASTIAFLYLFKFIFTVFLGQMKDDYREVKEAPVWLLLPQVILMGLLMAGSMYPNLILRPIMAAVEGIFPGSVAWDGYTVISSLGYWNGNAVMYVTMAVFALPLIWLLLVGRRPKRVEQFNMVFAGERPERPETTHFAHNFFAPYRRALGFLAAPGIQRFWSGVVEAVMAFGGTIRRIYTGNGQTYALHILLVMVVLFVATGGLRWI